MKILVVTAHYPPYHFGGYGIRIKNILDELSGRNCVIRILTTRPEKKISSDSQKTSYLIVRELHNRNQARFFPKELWFDLLDTRLLERHISKFNPDVIYLGHTYILSKALLPYLSRLNIPIIYDEGGSGLIEAWTEHGRWFRFTGNYQSRCAMLNLIKPLVIKAVCQLSGGRIKPQWSWPEKMKIFINSETNRRKVVTNEIPLKSIYVIHSGIDLEKFIFQPRRIINYPVKIIVPGRIERRKGQIDAIHLIHSLIASGKEVCLIFAGEIISDSYFDEINEVVSANSFTDYVRFLSMINQEKLIDLYHETDICFFPSYQEIGFSRVPLEAMACGCVVISYGNEGSDEVIRHRQNGFLAPAGDIQEVATLIEEMIAHPALIANIQNAARQDIESNYAMPKYVDQIESLLRTAVGEA